MVVRPIKYSLRLQWLNIEDKGYKNKKITMSQCRRLVKYSLHSKVRIIMDFLLKPKDPIASGR